jgi:hypothetical protein
VGCVCVWVPVVVVAGWTRLCGPGLGFSAAGLGCVEGLVRLWWCYKGCVLVPVLQLCDEVFDDGRTDSFDECRPLN